ncbi:TRAP transporter substrate-binding protein [Oceanobacillus alkalisoli]|uniref:TRAP transporter substrate-binding protein n=1 Tax=Oceanobacillus alkalisoli TaxID=2925113 RepID=UPI001F11C6A4|nr:TRAP transporter substrate-binding protein [Oceanobacillus alkalisoli]MCF3942585.1 TRAP transporter substrate-binding protein [Oceanobacillus alkalisoli]
MNRLILIIILGVSILMSACTQDASGEESESFNISYSTWANEGEPAFDGMKKFKEIVERETDGNITVDLYPGNQLGSTIEQMEQLKLGIIEMMSSGDPGLDEIEYLSLPYLMASNNHWTAVLESDVAQEWNDELINVQGVRTLDILPRGVRVISSNIEIVNPEDTNGFKIRTPAVDYYVQTFEALGANPTPMDMGELYSGLQTGVVEGQENPLETIYSSGLHEVQRYIINSNHMFKPAFVSINEEFFQSLPEEYRDIVEKAADEGREYAQEQLELGEEEMIKIMEESGVTFLDPDIEAFKEATQSVRDSLGFKIWGEEDYRKIVEIGQSELD